MQKNNLIWVIPIMALAGCSLFSQPYNKPDLGVPDTWSQTNKNLNAINHAESLAELKWWHQFDDPSLNIIIESALVNNTDIKIAMANLANAQGQLKQVQFSWIPNIPLVLGFSQMWAFNNPGYFLGLFPSYTLNIFSQLKAQDQAKHQLEVSKYATDGARLTVIGQAASGYFTLASQERQLQLAQELLKIYKLRETAYRKQFELGLTDAKTVSNASSDVMQVQAQLSTLENNILVSQNALRYLTNQNPGKIDLVTSFEKLNTNSIMPGSLPVTVLANRPDVKAAEEQLKASNAGVGLAYSNLLPSIQLDDFVAATSPTASGISNPMGMNMGEAYLNVPLLNPKAYGQIDSSKAQYSKDYYAYEQTVRKALRDVENDLSAHRLYAKRYDDLAHANLSLQQGCNNEILQFQNGLSNYTTVLECQIGLQQSQIALTQSKLDKLLAIVALYQDLGGGYAVESTESSKQK
jgi:NodT family efflux transporter outer membrane factor (OMF) lipoprotein